MIHEGRRRLLLLVAVAVAATGVLVALLIARNVTKAPVADLMYEGPSTYRDTAAPTKPNSPYTFGSLVLCLKGQGPVTITGIQADKSAGGLHVQGWGGRPNPNSVGQETIIDSPGSLQQLGFQVGRAEIEATCASTGQGDPVGPTTELAVELSKPSTEDAWLEGLLVTYRGRGGDVQTLRVPWVLGLCQSNPQDTHSSGVC